jgi:hypothetical protein
MTTDAPKPPKELDAIVDLVLAYKAKPKSAPGKKRKKNAAKIARAAKGNPKSLASHPPK